MLVAEVPLSPGSAPAEVTGESRRRELADFLSTRRARLQPEDVGLPRGGRRRTRGLRREEVAQLAGVGVTWYTWLEQGRDVRASLEVLEAIARGLRLSSPERIHLLQLGRGEMPPPQCEPERVSPTVRRMIENLGLTPAYITGRRWDLLAWNRAATAVFGDFGAVPEPARNQIWLTFMDPAKRELLPDWETVAHLSVAKFRAASARHIGDQAFEELIAALHRASPEFSAAWRRHDIEPCIGGQLTVRHPSAGTLRFEIAMFTPQEDSEQRLVVYSPIAEHDTFGKLAGLMRNQA
jgi:transcriptional regulator with XRE-family HTH domain